MEIDSYVLKGTGKIRRGLMDGDKESPEEADIFDLCRRPDCPRDIGFHCEALMNYRSFEVTKKPVSEEVSKKVHALLSAHFVEVNTNSPSGFCCSMCHYALKGVKDCIKHITGSGHQSNEAAYSMKFTAENLPNPSEAHCISVSRCLRGAVERVGISKAEILRRQTLLGELNEELQENNIECSLTLHGSSTTTLGFQDSDVNVMVVLNCNQEAEPSRRPYPSAEENSIYLRVVDFFQSHPNTLKISTCSVTKQMLIQLYESENETITIGLSKESKPRLDMTNMLTGFVNMSPLVRHLVVALRLWAKYIDADDDRKEGLPPFAWATLVIFFLQRTKFLPPMNPLTLQKPEACMPLGNQREALDEGLLGRLWIDLLRFYSSENLYSFVISMTGNSLELDHRVKDRKITIEDPFNKTPGKKSKIQTSPHMYEYISKMFMSAFLYFGIPRTCDGSMYEAILPAHRQDICSPFVFHQVLQQESAAKDVSEETTLDEIDYPKWNPVNLAVKVKGEREAREWLSSKPTKKLVSVKVRMFVDHLGGANVLEQDVRLLDQLFPDWVYEYKFERGLFFGKLKPPIFCKTCSSRQHYVNDCPSEKYLPGTSTDNNVDFSSARVIQEVMEKNYDLEALKDRDFNIRMDILSKLKEPLLQIYPDAALELFGSSVNGFGTHYSDIDMCLLLDDEDYRRNNTLAVMSKVQKTLFRLREFQVVYFVRHARIPIVKFRHIPSNLDGDISSCNTFAVRNSLMLRSYADIDPRVKIIGLFWKRMLKICDVSCAAKSGLSSYGFSLMLIHYFQQLEHPVLPILQQLQQQTRSAIMFDGWDLQYFGDVNNLKDVWEGYGQNRSSLGELWLGLLRYYSEVFDFESHVISIRESRPITKLSKFWISNSLISIEDPFLFGHNVGSCLSRKNSIRILNTIRKLRDVFMSQVDSAVLETYKDWLSYFTDPKIVQYQEASKSKCLICGYTNTHKPNCPQRRKKLKLDVKVLPTPDKLRFDEDIAV
ncbi:unnamed protein product [Allacma fusca]|uniref:Terminal uridylyltransferase 7 n=1 Tax=Allacma fusca TaxID=39272 RepID=A0A8J2NT84_9HEXA|nr:unnamed protein product [Allacma fusca]